MQLWTLDTAPLWHLVVQAEDFSQLRVLLLREMLRQLETTHYDLTIALQLGEQPFGSQPGAMKVLESHIVYLQDILEKLYKEPT